MIYSDRTMAALTKLGIAPERVAGRGLCEHPEEDGLVVAETARDGREFLLTPAAAQAWNAMRTAAASDGVTLYIISAFRSIERQVELIERKLAAGETLDSILTIIAPPGFSEHHCARAIDIGSPGAPVLDSAFDRTPAFLWLRAHAGAYGFVLSYPEGNAAGYQYEPWHWCFHAAV
ncbi:MAG: M15 family metallopeptidase [Chromatiales bacterium]|jgi:D-alanyl-D-alanine carboxypeptidase|nr:M15 family metallopeptidase [Chromatiales bacterium]